MKHHLNDANEEKLKDYFDRYLQLAIKANSKGKYAKKHFSHAKIEEYDLF